MALRPPTPEQKKYLARIASTRKRYESLLERTEAEYEKLVGLWYDGEHGDVPVPVHWMATAAGVTDPGVHEAIHKREAKLLKAETEKRVARARAKRAKAS